MNISSGSFEALDMSKDMNHSDINRIHNFISQTQTTSTNKLKLMLYGLILLIFVIDIIFPRGVAVGVLYAIPVLLSLLYPIKKSPYIIASGCSAFIALGYLFSSSGESVWHSLSNRALSLFVVWSTAMLVTQWKILETKREKALEEIKTLRGFIPICSSCKKIRDDKGYWNEVERYIGEHSEAQFSHSICPDCIRRFYPEVADTVLSRLEKDEKK